jgi:ribosome-associated heat shock protein Hsp15
VDRWLWAVRLSKTRSEATDAARGGHVRVDGRPAKAATTVAVGSRVELRLHGRDRVVEVTRVIEKRVGAAIAAECFEDHSPPPPPRPLVGPAGVRDRGAGRPTKRDRRRLEQLRGAPDDLPPVEIDDDW